MKVQSKFGFVYKFEQFRNGELIGTVEKHNLVTDEGLTYLLDVGLSAGTQITAFYVVPFENNHTPAAANTYAVPGYTECTAYDEATRPAFTDAGVSGKSLTNAASKASYTFNDTKTIYGAALVCGGTDPTVKGNTAGGGKLISLVNVGANAKAMLDDDVLKITVTSSIADDGV